MNNDLLDFLKKMAIDEAKNIATATALRKRDKQIQFLRLKKERIVNDLSSGRYTTIVNGMTGYILDEEEIATLCGATWMKKQKMLEEMMDAYDEDRIYALVGGYPCSLSEESYELIDSPPLLCLGELI